MGCAQPQPTFDDFYRRYYGEVRALASRRFGDNVADDVAQDVMLRAHHVFDQLSDVGNVWPWLAIVTRNTGINHVRATRRSVPMDLDGLELAAGPTSDGPAMAAEASDIRRRLGRAMARLPERDRRVLQMRELDRLPITDIAARHGASAGAIRQRLLRARRTLAREYQAVGGERLLVPAWLRSGPGIARRHLADIVASAPCSVQDGTTMAAAALLALLAAPVAGPALTGPPAPYQVRDIEGSVSVDELLPDLPSPGLRVAAGQVTGRLPAGCPRAAGVAAGWYASVVVRADGSVWEWTESEERAPRRVHGLPFTVSVARARSHTLALGADRTVWAWTDTQRAPRRLTGLPDVRAIATTAGRSIALAVDGRVWAWDYGTTSIPVPVLGLDQVTSVAAGTDHFLAARADGSVRAWGSNAHGQLGDGTTVDRMLPVRVTGLDGVVGVAAGAKHSLAVRRDGTLWAWGSNADGQLGDPTTRSRHEPAPVPGLSGVRAVSAAGNNSLALKTDGTAWNWGSVTDTDTGDANGTLRSPALVVTPIGMRAISAGETHSIAVGTDGSIGRWGRAVEFELVLPDCDLGWTAQQLPCIAIESARYFPEGRRLRASRCGTKGIDVRLPDGPETPRGLPARPPELP